MSCSRAGTPPLWKSRVPEPSRTGATFRRSRSTRPASTACRMMLAPPMMLTSLSPAASAARVTAAAMPSVTKVNVVALLTTGSWGRCMANGVGDCGDAGCPGAGLGAGVGHNVADRVADQGAEFGAGDVVERVPGHEQPAEHRAQRA